MGATSDRGVEMLANIELPERYQLVRRIASGGMASVWCAEDQVLGRRVAIKLLSERYAYDETAVQRFKREARVAARLSGHQNIVTIFDVGEAQWRTDETASRAFIVMEYLAGGTVGDAIRVGAMTREEAVRWVAQTASALDYAHARGVVHRDIKPANLLLDCDRFIHVADFGIARVATDESFTRTDMVLGTAAYISPEQAVGRPATAASDRYSLAVAAFELLVGERPFGAGQLAAQARQHVEELPPSATARNRDLPRGVDAVLARGMAKRPEDRWPSAGAFAEALATALSPRTAQTRVLSGAGAATRPNPRAVAAAAAAAATAPAAAAAIPAAARAAIPAVARAAPARAAPAGSAPAGAAETARSPRRSLALAALAAAILGVVLIATALAGGSGGTRRLAQVRHPARNPARTAAAPDRPATASKPNLKPKPKATTTTATTPPEVTGTAAAATTPAASADALEADGHALMNSGNYQAAVPILQQAVAAAPHGSLTYAYALYDLGRSLRLAGNPQAAVQVLYQRLQIPNQTGTVRSELQAALLQMGQRAGTAGGAPAAAGHASHGRGPDGHRPPGHGGD